MALNFSAAIDAWTKKSVARCEAVLRESTQRLIEQANTVGPSVNAPAGGAGGKMPVDTGFLRASMAVSFDGMPVGPGRNAGGNAVAYDDSQITLKLAGVKLGKMIYAGWTAEYAIYMEERYGFSRSATQNWQPIVTQVIAEAKTRFP